MSDKLEALKAVAKASYGEYPEKWWTTDNLVNAEFSDEDKAFIASFGPLMALDLLAALEELNKQMISDAVDAEYARLDMKRRAEAAEQREEHLKASVDVLSAKNAELQQRLQQPIKLPRTYEITGEFSAVVMKAEKVRQAIRNAGFKVKGE